jgi:deazaflavin-dependent oxidoreductase (nitroreductase family)
MPALVVILLAALAVVAVVGLVFVVGMRRQWPPVRAAIIWLGKVGFNRIQLRTAGTPGAYAAIIRHRGRVSGRMYETPVGVTGSPDGSLLIMLPYGRTDWLRNVLAAGEATLTWEGETFPVERPEVIALTSVWGSLSASDQRAGRMFGVREGLRLWRVRERPALVA